MYCAEHNRERLAAPPAAEPAASPEVAPETPPVSTAVQCRIPGCSERAEAHTIGARRQGGRYDICATHLEELRERANETRRRNREAQGLPPTSAAAEEALDRVNGLPPIPTPDLDGPTGDDPACPYWCALDQPHDGECRDFAGRTQKERIDGAITMRVESEAERLRSQHGEDVDAAPIIEPTILPPLNLAVEGSPEMPLEAWTWSERAEELTRVAERLDDLDREREALVDAWRLLSG